ncbi:MAG: histidine kinase [Steroidobacteraceae bacterium]
MSATHEMHGPGPAASPTLRLRTLLLIVVPFWTYVAASNLLYAHSFGGSLASMTGDHDVFAAPLPRLLQHLLLFGPLVGCYWASLRLGWAPWWRRAPLQLALAMVFAALPYPCLALAEHLQVGVQWAAAGKAGDTWFEKGDLLLWVSSATIFLLTYGFGLALVSGFAWYRHSRDTELQVEALERAVNETRLAALRMQLSPHTLFNLLHTIRGQIAFDPRAAQAMVVQLADLLRRLLAAGERELVPLAEELRLVRGYLELQQQRFADRLSVVLPPDDGLPDVWVPSLVLYPLAENAVVHGLAGHEGGVQVRIDIEADPEELRVRVANTLGRATAPAGAGIGLANLRERLAVQFGGRAALGAVAEAGEWRAELRLPRVSASP